MEFKKKTIIWEDNNEPPKDYIWAKKDGKFYEYSYATKSWVESKIISGDNSEGSGNGSGDGGGVLDNNFPYQPGKVKYWVLDIYGEGTHIDEEDGRKAIIDGEVIPAEELNNYIDEHWTKGGDQLQFLPMFDKDNFKNNLCFSKVVVDFYEKRIGTVSFYTIRETTYNGKEYYIGQYDSD